MTKTEKQKLINLARVEERMRNGHVIPSTHKCGKCQLIKSSSEFGTSLSTISGLRNTCKPCRANEYKKHRSELTEEELTLLRAKQCKTVKNAYQRDPEKFKQRRRNYSKTNPEKITQINKQQYQKQKQDSIKHLLRLKKQAGYRKQNPKRNFYTKMYKLRKKGATPIWLSEDQKKWIQWYYIQADRLTKLTGEQYHVDHIHPIQGENFCGLHVPWNLQVLPAKENLSKSNKLQCFADQVLIGSAS
jgi:hypothetical protein